MARAGGGGGLTLSISPVPSVANMNAPMSGTHTLTSSHHFEFTGKIGVNGPLGDDGNGMSMAVNPSLAAVRGSKTVAKRSSGKLGDFQLNTSSLRSVLGSGGASITSGAAARRGSGQLMAPPLQSGNANMNGNGMMNGMNGNNNNEKSPNPSSSSTNNNNNNNNMRPPSQQHVRRFSAATTGMSLSVSPSLPTLGMDGHPSGRHPSHARSQSRSASPQPQPQQFAGDRGERVPLTLNHSTSVKQFGHAHSLSLSVHGATSPSGSSQTSLSSNIAPNPSSRLLAARAPREPRRRTADRGEVKTLISAAMGGHGGDRNAPTMAFAVSSASSSSPKHSPSSRVATTTGFGPGPTDTSSRDETGEHELRTSIKTARIDRVRAAVDRSSININVKDQSGDTILHNACLKGNLEIVQILLRQRKEIDCNIVNNLGWTALMVACGGGALDVVKCLVQEAPNLNINIHRSNGWTAVMEAAKYGHHSIVQYLVSVGAHTSPTRSGESLLEIRPMLPCTRIMIAEAVRKGQQILNGQPVTGPPSARGKAEAKEFREIADSDDDDDDPMSARSQRKMQEAKEALRKRAEKLTDSKSAGQGVSTLKMAEAAIIREDLLKEQLATANSLMARAQMEVERIKAESHEQTKQLSARVDELETLLKQERVKNDALSQEVMQLRSQQLV